MKLPDDPRQLMEMESATLRSLQRAEAELSQIKQQIDSLRSSLAGLDRKKFWMEFKLFYVQWASPIRKWLALPGWIRFLVWMSGGITLAVGLAITVGSAAAVGGLMAGCIVALFSAFPNDVTLEALRQTITNELPRLLESRAQLLADLARKKEELARIEQEFVTVRDTLEEIRRSRLHRLAVLASADWRSLRGEMFERFLMQVLNELGYRVHHTGKSGDQGVDIICERDGYRVAVQVKGYTHSVGNDAVQEAYSGKAFYQCHGCAVITNSVFTSGARELAERVGCLLIDQTMLPDLIFGKIDLIRLSCHTHARSQGAA
ncbi:MAG: restriction endonuclease [Thermogutta sp.]|uniref:restriction endonuclease n=1 Tax=Thermogutta sp. TaxID=1962930 RepID=UPI0019CBF1A7|nr:restriction endonuclease [Thermogutta sp.]MBC7352201.1 restriction endonuclease [Thermogutta sp.]